MASLPEGKSRGLGSVQSAGSYISTNKIKEEDCHGSSMNNRFDYLVTVSDPCIHADTWMGGRGREGDMVLDAH